MPAPWSPHPMTNAEELKSSGLKATLPRIKILEVFQQAAQRHMTAEDVYKLLLTEGSDIGLATVYRVLMQFEQAGILSRNHFEAGSEAGKAVFELNSAQHHDHMVCVECGRILEFQSPQMELHQNQAIKEHGFEALWHRHEIFGRCRNCVSKRRNGR